MTVPVEIPTPDDPVVFARRHIGMQLVDVAGVDGVMVWTLRPIGRTSRRHMALAGVTQAYEVREGSQMMRAIEAAKFSTPREAS